MRILFMGSPEFAVPALQALMDSPHDITTVYTQPPRPAGRGKQPRPTPVHQLAESANIPVYHPSTLKTDEARAPMRASHADIAVVAAYGLLLPTEVLAAFPLGCINIHPSLLPRWRGAAPIQRSIMAGDTETGVCIMQMEEGLDSGPVLACETTPIPPGSTAGELHDKLAKQGAALLLNTLMQIENGIAKATLQPENGVTYAKKITKEEAALDFARHATELLHHIHGLSPFPGAFTTHNGERIKILKAELTEGKGTPGIVLDNALTIACSQGAIRPTLLQRAGKKPMERSIFLQGFSVPEGSLLVS